MAAIDYEALTGDNVQFLQGTQAQLNKYFVGSGDAKAGKAAEGTFYLTNDTHRLYVGRKIDGSNNIVPVQVSAGITTVADSGALADISKTTAQEGDFYYIESDNILAIFREYVDNGVTKTEWVQINPPTGISNFTTSAATSTTATNVKVTSTITTESTSAPSKSASFAVKAGNNIALTAETVDGVSGFKIDATDTTYAAGTAATTAGSSNGATIGLKKNGGSSLDSSISITGAGGVGVTSTANGAVTVTGPEVTGISVVNGVNAANNDTGFKVAAQYTPGDGSAAVTTSYSRIDPQVNYGGAAHSAGDTSTADKSTKFVSGAINLDVYTVKQTDAAIKNAIDGALQVADAMTYVGAVSSSGSDAGGLLAAITANGGAHKGDTFKASAQFTLGTATVYPGDLIIINGTEGSNGIIATNDITYDIIPSGDEPLVQSAVTASGASASNNTIVQLVDGKKSSNNDIQTVTFVKSGEKIRIDSTSADSKHINITVNHTQLDSARTASGNANGDKNNLSLVSSSASDTIGTGKYKFLVLNGTDGLKTDDYGHVLGLQGKEITFEHNRLNTVSTGYSVSSKVATITHTLTDKLSQSVNPAFKIVSDTLQLSTVNDSNAAATGASATRLKVELVWGDF